MYEKQQTGYGYSGKDEGANIATRPHNDRRRKVAKAPKNARKDDRAGVSDVQKLHRPEKGKIGEQNGGDAHRRSSARCLRWLEIPASARASQGPGPSPSIQLPEMDSRSKSPSL